ncbi:MAG: hypothetical protein FWH20_04295, partial [Oscillospiraceae bacterium]|nr:hypothetical protein [Oscillospiraceae bacterium]
MRKLHKNLISEIVASLKEANAEIQKLYFNKDIPVLAALLADCTESTIQLCDFITQLEGATAKTCSCLNDYCDILSKIATDFDNGYELIKQLKKQIITIENSVKNDLIIDKIEVVFLPYRASMWDSLESIYLAAKDDPQCEVYVISIPFYELNPDGTFGKMHCDSGLYPPNVTITNWEKYDIETRCPDVIYTHYPYDDNVTNYSIHPDFYSKKLCKNCDLLVHVPYHVVAGGAYADYYHHLDGVKYADFVIVQSEEVRKSCVNFYNIYDKQFSWNGQFGKAEKKFVALGSPKFDKVINTDIEDCVLPEEWRNLIFKPDGSRKKVVLYNTRMWAWLNCGEKYFKKLRCVFDTFRGRNDAVLWWRPHPNTEMNFKVKRPELLDEYYKVVEEFRSANFGVYDDTADLHRAIAWSDAYYGDGGSLFSLYNTTGKPLMYQNASIPGSLSPHSLPTEIFYDDGKNYWFTTCHYTFVFKMDKLSHQIKCVGYFANENYNKYLYGHIEAIGERLYFAPYEANEIGVYNTKTNQFETTVINKDKLPKIFTQRTFDIPACNQASQKIISKIDSSKAMHKNFDKIKDIYDCLFYEFSFVGLPEFLEYIICDQENDSKNLLRDKQIEVAKQITENTDGTCGIKTHEYI